VTAKTVVLKDMTGTGQETLPMNELIKRLQGC
jgi:hypothetical protein